MNRVLLLLVTFVMAIIIAACGGGGGGGGGTTPSSDNALITGNAIKGPIVNGSVTAYSITSSGGIGPTLGTTTTDVSGAFILSLKYTGSVLIEVSGGSYVDEATGKTITLPAAQGAGLQAVVNNVVPGSVLHFHITPLTTMAATRALKMVDGLTASNIDAANQQVADHFGGIDILNTQPINPLVANSASGATQNAIDYGLILAGLSEEAQTLELANPFELVTALAQDFSDGSFDGLSGISSIQLNGSAMTAAEGTTELAKGISSFSTDTARNKSGGSVTLAFITTLAPATVQLTATANDPLGNPLSYHWRATDGDIVDVNLPTTIWTLPDGPGLHFAYVLVANGMGGYTERRIVVNTDDIGYPTQPRKVHDLVAPPATLQPGQYNRDTLTAGSSSNSAGGPDQDIYLVDTPVYMQDTLNNLRFPPIGVVKTNLKGEFVVPGVVLNGAVFTNGDMQDDYFCSTDLGATFGNCGGTFWISNLSIESNEFTHFIDGNIPSNPFFIIGVVLLSNGSVCGTQNEFFGKEVTATASLLDANGNTLVGPVRADAYGGYAIPAVAGGATVLLQCEGASSVTLPVSATAATTGDDLGTTQFLNTGEPVVSSMKAELIGTSVGTFLPPPSGLPSDKVPRDDQFLNYKGLDSRVGACQYYKAIGAVQDCDTDGNFIGAVSFDDWKRAVKIGPYATAGGPTEYTATYINQVDLNLARNHHSISYGPNQTAAYVCNHLGPSTLNPSQDEIDTVIDNTLAGKNLVACVAMDYSISPGVNNDMPFTRFLIFGPNGELLPSVNLDGRREKFVPGTCVVCHGGDHYAGKFPEDGSGPADIGGYFLPYDAGNFAFSSKPGLTEAEQSLALYNLNMNVLNAGPNAAIQGLIQAWYVNGTTLDKNYVPPSWQAQGSVAVNYYKDVYARSCRTCHISMVEGYNFDDYQNVIQSNYADTGDYDFWLSVCGDDGQIRRIHSMPNSLVTFNRFWLSTGTASDQVDLTQQFMNFIGDPCTSNIAP